MVEELGDMDWLCNALKIKRTKARELIRCDAIPYIRISPYIVRFNKEEVMKFIKSRKRQIL